MKTVIILFFLLLTACQGRQETGRAASPADSSRIELSPHLPPYKVGFQRDSAGRITQIRVSEAADSTKAIDTIEVLSDVNPALMGKYKKLYLEDINFDGYKDLALVTSLPTLNSTPKVSYWIFNEDTRKFISQGEYDIFLVDKASKSLVQRLRGGRDNQEWRAMGYKVVDDWITYYKFEEQKWDDSSKSFMRTVTELKGCDWVTTQEPPLMISS